MAAAGGAFVLWGLLPLFFALVSAAGPLEIVAQRVVWSLAFLAVLIPIAGRGRGVWAAFRDTRALLALAASAALIVVNWLVYVWAVTNGAVLAASLGYFLNPLINVVAGRVVLGERLDRAQGIAVALAAVGVALLAIEALDTLWISLTLAISFASYGLIRKMVAVEAMEGLAVETALLTPIAMGLLLWLAVSGGLAFGSDLTLSILLAVSGVVTAVPLLLFATGARLLRYATVGLLQFIGPSIQFGLGVVIFDEALSRVEIACFALIWAGCIAYALANLRQVRTRGRAMPEPSS